MDARCKNCRWWDTADDLEHGGNRRCHNATLPRDARGYPSNELHIFTRPEFGCIHWQPVNGCIIAEISFPSGVDGKWISAGATEDGKTLWQWQERESAG